MLAEQFRMQFYVARFVDTVHVTEASGDAEIRGDCREGAINVIDVFGLGVEGVVVNVFVIDTVFFTASYANFLSSISVP